MNKQESNFNSLIEKLKPQEKKTSRIAVRLTPSDYEKIAEYCKKNNTNHSKIISLLIRNHL